MNVSNEKGRGVEAEEASLKLLYRFKTKLIQLFIVSSVQIKRDPMLNLIVET